MSVANLWGQLKTGANAGVLSGGLPFAGTFRYVGTGAPTFATRYDTIAAALAALVPNDVLMLGPQRFDEGNLVLPASATGVTIFGCGPRGSCFIEPSTVGQAGLQILADDVTLVNVGVAGEATATHGLKIGSQTVSPARFRAYGCKFEGVTAVNPAAAVILQGTGDTIFDDCEFAWCANAILGLANDDGFPTQTRIRNSLFHNYTTVGIGVKVGDVFVDLWVSNNLFANQEDGSAPTDYVLLSDNGNIGVFDGNRFATATNATGVLTIGTGILWLANATEAGWSTGRPA